MAGEKFPISSEVWGMGMGGVFTIGDISENYFVLFRMLAAGWLTVLFA